MKRTVIGILAHVDAGKTTLAEAMLYCSGTLRKLGRVDHGNAFLDTFELERKRGITIFSKQAILSTELLHATLLDTPGHADFSAEMERTLNILDCAILVIGGTSGIQSHTRTIWKLLRDKKIPTFIFVSKMDLPGADKEIIYQELRRVLSNNIVDLSIPDLEDVALCDETLFDELLDTGTISDQAISRAISYGRLYPIWFGSALKLDGVEEFLHGLELYAPESTATENFSAKIYKISYNNQGGRETHLKVTGGILHTRQCLSGTGWSEKVTQLRVYSGSKFQTTEAAYPGDVVAAIGLTHTYPGMGLGSEANSDSSVFVPVLTYQVIPPEGYDIHRAVEQIKQLEEEEPHLHVAFNPSNQEIRLQVMGPIQLEVLHELLAERFHMEVEFGRGNILYLETISAPVEGVGHYEPLRHYAEVHLLLEPGARGSGLIFDSNCPENSLDRNWQKLILTHLAEKTHLGVLTGSPITDMKITLVNGKAHQKHTEGGDFRQATYRAVRQGLMQANSILLEPWYDFRLELPKNNVGRAMTDLQHLGAELSPISQTDDTAVLTGSAPVAVLRNYSQDIIAYTHGLGNITYSFHGYAPCANQDSVVASFHYNPEADLNNTPDSIFCKQGAGHIVKWSEVPNYMHLPSILKTKTEDSTPDVIGQRYKSMIATDKELLEIFERTYGPIRKNQKQLFTHTKQSLVSRPQKAVSIPTGPEYLLVDGYNIIFAWPELKELAKTSLDAARERLLNILRNYQSFRQCPVILVFDAYKVKGNPGSVEQFGGLSVVYTKEAQTADMYIERLSFDLSKKHRVRVATSDSLEQIIILGHGALRISASAFEQEVKLVMEEIRRHLISSND